MGEGAAAVLASTNITVEERKDDPNIQWRLLAEPNLTLKKATEIAQALETADRGAADLQSAQAVLVHSIEGENNASKSTHYSEKSISKFYLFGITGLCFSIRRYLGIRRQHRQFAHYSNTFLYQYPDMIFN